MKEDKMEKLENTIENKLISEGRKSFMSIEEAQRIYLATHERMTNYKRTLAKREYYSHIQASQTILRN
jgi:hypothetical protein